MTYIKLETSQNVLLDYPTANTVERILAYLVDMAILGLYFFVLSQTGFFVKFGIFDHWKDATLSEFFLNLFVFFPVFFYDLVFEVFNNGKTPGKMLFKMQVIKINGEPASFSDYCIRWLMRPIDIYGTIIFSILILDLLGEKGSAAALVFGAMTPGLIAVLVTAINPTGQRIGDFLAETAVIKSRTIYSLKDTILQKTETSYIVKYPNALKLSDKDVRLIKETLEYYRKTNDSKYILQLATKAKEFLDIDTMDTPVKFLAKLMQDYNHLAMEENGRI